jgi:deoxyhypusine synthase
MELAEAAVLVKSEQLPSDTPIVKGYDFNEGIDYDKLLQACMHTGFQATSFALAVQQINQMVISTGKYEFSA